MMGKLKSVLVLFSLATVGFIGGQVLTNEGFDADGQPGRAVEAVSIIGEPLPEITGRTHKDSLVDLGTWIAGNDRMWTVVPVFSTSCGKCLGEAIEWKRMVEEFEGVDVVGLTPEVDSENLTPFVRATDGMVEFLSVDSIVPLQLGVRVFPTIFIVDEKGRVVESETGGEATLSVENWLLEQRSRIRGEDGSSESLSTFNH